MQLWYWCFVLSPVLIGLWLPAICPEPFEHQFTRFAWLALAAVAACKLGRKGRCRFLAWPFAAFYIFCLLAWFFAYAWSMLDQWLEAPIH
jgi:hypothetical protein